MSKITFLDNMQDRYTTKVYDPTKRISHEKKEALKEILRLSPSSINSQPWQFVFVSDKKVKAELADAARFNKEKILAGDTVVVFRRVEDLSMFENDIKDRLHETAYQYYVNVVKTKSAEEVRSWLSCQVYLSLGVFLSACANMGIDATPMEGIDPQAYDRILGDDRYVTLFAVTIGGRHESDFNQPSTTPKSRKPLDEIIREL